jgi:hypothetical protein
MRDAIHKEIDRGCLIRVSRTYSNSRELVDSTPDLMPSSLSILAATLKRVDVDVIDHCKEATTRRLTSAFSHRSSREMSHSQV